jgi:hypothetical protein
VQHNQVGAIVLHRRTLAGREVFSTTTNFKIFEVALKGKTGPVPNVEFHKRRFSKCTFNFAFV